MGVATTTSQTGVTSAASTWTGGTIPFGGDTATVQHAVTMDVNSTWGSSPAAGGTPAVNIIGPAGKLTIASGVTFTCKGPITLASAAQLIMNAGSTLKFDASNAASPSTATYAFTIPAGCQLIVNGTQASPCTITSQAGSANGYLHDGGVTNGGSYNLNYAYLTKLGDTTNPSLAYAPSNSSYLGLNLNHVIFDTGGQAKCNASIADGTTVNWQNVTFKNSVGADCFYYTSPNALTSGSRILSSIVFDKNVNLYPAGDVTMSNLQFRGGLSQTTSRLAKGLDGALVTQPSFAYYGDISNAHFVLPSTTDNPHFITPPSGPTIPFTISNTTYEAPVTVNTTDSGDFFVPPAPAGTPTTYTLKNILHIPAVNGMSSGELLSAGGGANTRVVVEHCTYDVRTDEPGANPYSRLGSVGESYNWASGQVLSFKSNAATSPTSRKAYLYSNINGSPITDTALAAVFLNNAQWNMTAGSKGQGVNAPITGTISVLNADPQYVDRTRNTASWDLSLGGPGTIFNALAELAKVNDFTGYNPAYSVANLLNYLRGGFAPTNPAYHGTAHDGTDIGAVPWVAAAGSTGGSTGGGSSSFPPPLPARAQWDAAMNIWGPLISAWYAANPSGNSLERTRYDAMKVFYKIYDYTGDPQYITAAQRARTIYRDGYLGQLANPPGAASGFNIFPHGLYIDATKYGNQTSANYCHYLATVASFTPDTQPLAAMTSFFVSREAAFVVEAYLVDELLGQPERPHLEPLIDIILGHFDQWFVAKTATFTRPFMVALSCEALIKYYTQKGRRKDVILSTILFAANYLWENFRRLNDPQLSFHYTDVDTKAFSPTAPGYDTGGTEASIDLNCLILPVFGWLYNQTGDQDWILKADRLYTDSVPVYNASLTSQISGSFMGVSGTDPSGKQFMQCFRWIFDYFDWRAATPVTGAVTTGGGTTGGGTTGGGTTPIVVIPTINDTRTPSPKYPVNGQDNQVGILNSPLGTTLRHPAAGVAIETGLGKPFIVALGTDTTNTQLFYFDPVSGSLRVPGKLIAQGLVMTGTNTQGGDAGQVTLASGTVTVTLPTISDTAVIILSRKTVGGVAGNLSYTIAPGVGFTVNSDNSADTSQVSYLVVNPVQTITGN